VQAQLQSTGAFAAVDAFDASTGTPTLALLSRYDAVLVFANVAYQDAIRLGDVLAQYFDAGGRVVTSPYSNGSPGGRFNLGGTFGDLPKGYMFYYSQTFAQSPGQLGAILDPTSPLVAGVSTLTCPVGLRGLDPPVNGGTVVATWNDGSPLLIAGVTASGRKRVELNFAVASSKLTPLACSGDITLLLKNAMFYQ
jgi:hypothetical protein